MYYKLLNLAILALLGPAWYAAGRITARLKLPLITGYLLAGVASGPYVFNVITTDGLVALIPVDHICLSLIALAAGAELQLAELHKIKRQVTWITLGISACTWVLVFTCAVALGPYIPFMAATPEHTMTAIASLVATLAVARSPASAIAVLKETEGKGPYCSLVMAVVVLKDVLVFICFAVNIELAKAASKAGEAITLSAGQLLEPLVSICASLLLGVVGGYVMAALRQPSVAGARWNLARLLPAGVRVRLRPAVPLMVSGATFWVAATTRGEPLLACVTAGLVVANLKFGPAGRDATDLLMTDMTRLMPVVNLAFFGLVGASLKLAAVRDTLWAASLLYFVRLAGIWVGCYGGALLGGTPSAVGAKVWMGMVTQAGVALGLARIVSGTFSDWGPDFSALAAGVVLMNLFTGPPLFKAAVIAVGEARAIGVPMLAPEFDSGGLKQEPRPRPQKRSIPQIPIISADAFGVTGASLKQLMTNPSRELPD